MRERERAILHIFPESEQNSELHLQEKTKLKGLKEGILTFFLERLLTWKKTYLSNLHLKVKKDCCPKVAIFLLSHANVLFITGTFTAYHYINFTSPEKEKPDPVTSVLD